MTAIVETPGRTTDLERQVWQLVNAQAAAEDRAAGTPPASTSS
jgi:hypothetical protein